MKILFLVAVILILIMVLSSFFYKYVKRIVKCFNIDVQQKRTRFIIICSCIVTVVVLTIINMTILIMIAHMIVVIMLCDIINLIVHKFENKKSIRLYKWRKIYNIGILPIIATIIIFAYGHYNMYNVIETSYNIKTSKNIRSEGYKIAMLADVHYGVSLKRADLEKYCDKISSEEPDIVVICGDLIDESTTLTSLEEVSEILGKIKTKQGIFYVYGNHDLSRYSKKANYTTGDLKNNLEKNNIQLLDDKCVNISEDFSIIGRLDVSLDTKENPRKSLSELTKNLDEEDFWLVLDHQPQEYKKAKENKIDLEVSGHTHSGQYFPVREICEIFGINDMQYGHKKDGDFQAVVTSGIAGWGSPFRTENHSEYVIINIESNK